jgi:hypothetical protein
MARTKPEFIPYIDAANAEIARLHAKVEAAVASKAASADGSCPTCEVTRHTSHASLDYRAVIFAKSV